MLFDISYLNRIFVQKKKKIRKNKINNCRTSIFKSFEIYKLKIKINEEKS